MELQIGDRLTDETGEYEITGRPYTTNAGKDVHARVKRIDNVEITMIRTWGAHERISVKRAGEGRMNRLRRALVTVAFYLLASATSASAEGAWLLWAETYETVSASDTKEACEHILGEHLAWWRTGPNVTVDETTAYVRSKSKSGPAVIASVHYVCLPDTVDPRGPKGK
jgi:hypothetical protein